MAAVARNTGRYWRMYKQSLLVKLVDSVLGLSGLANHTLTVKTGGVTANQLIDVQQSALGDFSGKFGLLVVHSRILAEYKKLGLLNYNQVRDHQRAAEGGQSAHHQRSGRGRE